MGTAQAPGVLERFKIDAAVSFSSSLHYVVGTFPRTSGMMVMLTLIIFAVVP